MEFLDEISFGIKADKASLDPINTNVYTGLIAVTPSTFFFLQINIKKSTKRINCKQSDP